MSSSSNEDTSPAPLSMNEEAVARALRAIRRPQPLDSEELEILRLMLDDFKYKKMRREELRKNWPFIALVLTIGSSALTSAAAYIVNHWSSTPGGKP